MSVDTAAALPLALGLLAALLLAALGWWALRRGATRTVRDAAAAYAAAETLPGFRATAALVGADGAAALVGGAGGRLALVTPRARRLAAREIAWSDIRAAEGGMLVEGRGGGTLLAGVSALDTRALAPPARSVAVMEGG